MELPTSMSTRRSSSSPPLRSQTAPKKAICSDLSCSTIPKSSKKGKIAWRVCKPCRTFRAISISSPQAMMHGVQVIRAGDKPARAGRAYARNEVRT